MTRFNQLQKINFIFNCTPQLLQLAVHRASFLGFNVPEIKRVYSTNGISLVKNKMRGNGLFLSKRVILKKSLDLNIIQYCGLI